MRSDEEKFSSLLMFLKIWQLKACLRVEVQVGKYRLTLKSLL